MNEYRVRYRQTETYEVLVEAESVERAYERVESDDIADEGGTVPECKVIDSGAVFVESVELVEEGEPS